MLDGDKTTCLLASFLKVELEASGIDTKSFKFAAIQNSYANGASTKYLKEKLNCEIVQVKTGVKNMEAAAKDYDIALMFESNGHGTVTINDKVKDLLSVEAQNERAKTARTRLLALRKVCNQAVGDAISMLLAVIGVLAASDMSIEQWDDLYKDLPCVQAKVAVPDRTLAVPNENETKLVKPVALQNTIDSLVAGVPGGRAFVRPSGTEDIIRVYSEADTADLAKLLANNVEKAVVNEFGKA